MSKISDAVTALQTGRFVLIHDNKERENEVDMVISAESISPQHILTMRKDAGGLIWYCNIQRDFYKIGITIYV